MNERIWMRLLKMSDLHILEGRVLFFSCVLVKYTLTFLSWGGTMHLTTGFATFRLNFSIFLVFLMPGRDLSGIPIVLLTTGVCCCHSGRWFEVVRKHCLPLNLGENGATISLQEIHSCTKSVLLGKFNCNNYKRVPLSILKIMTFF